MKRLKGGWNCCTQIDLVHSSSLRLVNQFNERTVCQSCCSLNLTTISLSSSLLTVNRKWRAARFGVRCRDGMAVQKQPSVLVAMRVCLDVPYLLGQSCRADQYFAILQFKAKARLATYLTHSDSGGRSREVEQGCRMAHLLEQHSLFDKSSCITAIPCYPGIRKYSDFRSGYSCSNSISSDSIDMSSLKP